MVLNGHPILMPQIAVWLHGFRPFLSAMETKHSLPEIRT